MPDTDTELTDAEKDNFAAQPETDAGAAGAAGYVANFDGDEYDGKRYQMGERIADGLDAGTIAYLVQNGRISPFSGDDTNPQPSLGDGSDPAIPNEKGASDADKLASDNTKDELLTLAKDEGVADVSDSNTKAEIAAKIVAARAA